MRGKELKGNKKAGKIVRSEKKGDEGVLRKAPKKRRKAPESFQAETYKISEY